LYGETTGEAIIGLGRVERKDGIRTLEGQGMGKLCIVVLFSLIDDSLDNFIGTKSVSVNDWIISSASLWIEY
jgi:hypothetical protein